MMGFDDGWASWLPRTAALRCFGNAVVPQVSALAWSLFLADNAQERAA